MSIVQRSDVSEFRKRFRWIALATQESDDAETPPAVDEVEFERLAVRRRQCAIHGGPAERRAGRHRAQRHRRAPGQDLATRQAHVWPDSQ